LPGEIVTERLSIPGTRGNIQAFLARPAPEERNPAIIVIHEIYGLVEHIESVAIRFAREGYVAVAPDLFGAIPELKPLFTKEIVGAVLDVTRRMKPGGVRDTSYVSAATESLPEPLRGSVREFISKVFGGRLPFETFVSDLSRTFDHLTRLPYVNSARVGSVGFCFGGGLSITLACTVPVAACIVFYGSNPSPIELVERIKGPVLGLYGAEDTRINQGLGELVSAMVRFKKDFEMKIYPGAGHAFFNETNPVTFREEQARDAWERSVYFLGRTLLRKD
jgi:carboxymethylenebutenolidase